MRRLPSDGASTTCRRRLSAAWFVRFVWPVPSVWITKTSGLPSCVDTKPICPAWLGYSNVGTVLAVGSKITRYKIGDRLACNSR